MSNALFLLLVLACPLMMVFMMRGMHGGHGHGSQGGDQAHGHCGHGAPTEEPLDELKRRRDELDREIAARAGVESDAAEEEEATQPVA